MGLALPPPQGNLPPPSSHRTLTKIQRQWRDRLAKLEPGLELREISVRLAQSYSAVQRWAAFFGYQIRDGRGHRESRVDWNAVDWSLRDAEIARACGVCRERVRQVRHERGAGLAAPREAALRFRQYLEEHRSELGELSLGQVLRRWGGRLSRDAARRIAAAAGLRLPRAKPKWNHLDWRLPNRELGQIYRLREQHVANIRSRLKIGPALWDSRNPATEADPAFQAARAAELRRHRYGEAAVGVPRTYWAPSDGDHDRDSDSQDHDARVRPRVDGKPRLPIRLTIPIDGAPRKNKATGKARTTR